MVAAFEAKKVEQHTVPEAGNCEATWKREFKLLCREVGPPNHHDDRVDSDE